MKQLNPKSVYVFFIKYISAWTPIYFVIFFWFRSLQHPEVYIAGENAFLFLSSEFALALNFFALVIVTFFIIAKLSYYFYRYELTEVGFKKESGIIYKKYVTITYERIQNVDITRGLLERILGLSSLFIQTAGSGAHIGAEGTLPGLSRVDAEQLRDELIRRSRQSLRQGL